MKQIMYDMGHLTVARWLFQRVLEVQAFHLNTILAKEAPDTKNEKK